MKRDKDTKAASDLADIGGVTKLDSTSFEGMTIEQVVSLEDGQQITGIFRGEGDAVEVSQEKTVEAVDSDGVVTKKKITEIKPLKTWRIEIGPERIAQLVSSAQLDRKMPNIAEGSKVAIGRIGKGTTRKGQQITRYVIGVTPPPKPPAQLESPDADDARPPSA